ncbi:unnamed protein product [Caenorhabditis angaria]|uniref:Uncharacterized protein n=1 Tax=Caenorhabditis angaria TaxID=860376 RepID=A0A9P1MYZ4_9PELO|nr:unnamed protein product [Caenorhabditis angaria]
MMKTRSYSIPLTLEAAKSIEECFASNIFRVASFLRINFDTPGPCRKINFLITFILFILGIYTVTYNAGVTFSTHHDTAELAAQLLIVLWAIQSIISGLFLINWQLNGEFAFFRQILAECQNLRGLKCERGKSMMKITNRYFHFQIFVTCMITSAFALNYHFEDKHSEFNKKQSYIFYYQELRPIYTLITTYLYIIWNMTLFVLILYTNATYLEVKYFNEQLEQFDGSDDSSTCQQLIEYLEVYSNLCTVIRKLDVIFRLYTFIMIVITVPSMIFTLMMMNHRIHGLLDLFMCMPTIALCAFSFFAVTISPARLHDEINKTKGCICQNKSIWFPYRKEVYLIANTLTCHMEQFDLGVSVWGFAILSRPLILGTLSATAMMLSLLAELAPKTDLLNLSNKLFAR